MYLTLGLFAVCVYFLLPSGAAQAVLYDLLGMSTVAALVVGARRYRPDRPLIWYLFAASILTQTVGDIIWDYYENVLEAKPFPSIADVFYLGTYPLLVAGLLLLVRSRTPGGDRASLIDATITATGLGMLSWVFLMAPRAYDPTASLMERLISISYPLMDVFLLGVAVRLVVSRRAHTAAYRFLVSSLVFVLISDTLFAWMELTDSYQTGSPIDAGWLLFHVLFGTAALHPSMRALSEPAPDRGTRLTTRRLALLAAASLLAPATLAIQAIQDGPIDVPVIVGASAVLFLLVLIRMEDLIRVLAATLAKLERAAARERILRKAGAELVAASDREGVYRSALNAALDLAKAAPETRASVVGICPTGEPVAEDPTAEAKGARFEVRDLADSICSSLLAGRPVEAGYSDDADLWKTMGLGPGAGFVLMLPLLLEEELEGAIVVTGDRTLPEELKDAFKTLGSQVSLALESVHSQERLAYQASHDPLTNLPNRSLFMDRLEQALGCTTRPQEFVAALLLDLDNFKNVNDSLGHAAGDRLLLTAGERIKACLRPEDTVARFGGDEFAVLLESVTGINDAARVAERVVERLEAPFAVEEREVFVSISIGIALGTPDHDPGSLMRNADTAMYRAKNRGKARYEVFEEDVSSQAFERPEPPGTTPKTPASYGR